jgi:hypothetical protein
MLGGIEGERPRGELTAQQTNQSEEAQNQPESSEGQPLPGVWEVLERKARVSDEVLSGRMSRAEYDRELDEVSRLKAEVDEQGTERDKHIFSLLYTRRPSSAWHRCRQLSASRPAPPVARGAWWPMRGPGGLNQPVRLLVSRRCTEHSRSWVLRRAGLRNHSRPVPGAPRTGPPRP